MPLQEIEELKKCFVEKIAPERVYLFGSYADGSYNENSDFDFYIVVKDDTMDIPKVTAEAYRAIRRVKTKPVDIVIGTKSRFDQRKTIPSVENEVFRKGVLLYGPGNETMA
jgi:predicted nucleotidyltransferase